MPQPGSRAQRRQHARGGGGPQAPKRRDPMMAAFIALGVIVLAVIGVFVGINLQQQHAIVVANATPTPGPNTNSKPIQLIANVGIGTPAFPNPMKTTVSGGNPIDGITCMQQEGVALHIHSHLSLFVDGKQLQIPAGIGIVPTAGGGCLYWLHTHDATGIIHVEAPQIEPPSGSQFTLGMFFDIWGRLLTPDDVAGKIGPVTAYVNGAKWDGDVRSIPLLSHQQITLEIGKYVPPPNYAFPYGD